jgi:hypothetical protein
MSHQDTNWTNPAVRLSFAPDFVDSSENEVLADLPQEALKLVRNDA